MKKESLEFLRKLSDVISPSGYEEEAVGLWKQRTKKFADKITSDVHGNGIAVVNKDKAPRIMLAGHIDEIGYMVKYIDKEGFLYFSTVGGIDVHLIPGQRVWIKTSGGNVLGVIGKKPIHVQKPEERGRLSKLEDLFIDVGSRDDKETRKRISIGDVAVPAVGFENLSPNAVIGRGFDDKVGAFIVSETLRLISQKKITSAVYGVATVQEEIGLRGAKTSAYEVAPDIGIAIDVTFATDYPGMDKRKVGDLRVGGGPVIGRGPNINPRLYDFLIKVAEKEKIPYQVHGLSSATGTDANVIQLTRSGVATGLVSVPVRYIHTPVELANLNDLEHTANLLAAFIAKVNKNNTFIP